MADRAMQQPVGQKAYSISRKAKKASISYWSKQTTINQQPQVNFVSYATKLPFSLSNCDG